MWLMLLAAAEDSLIGVAYSPTITLQELHVTVYRLHSPVLLQTMVEYVARRI